MNSIAYILIVFGVGCACGYVFSHYRTYSLQNSGEALVTRAILSGFCSPDFHLLNHITLRVQDGTTQIDHILVSRFGVFVIETKDYSGWIFANAKHSTWTQVIFHRKSRFQNPIHQNFKHVRAVQELLDFLPPEAVRSVVVFAGDAEFKTEIPTGVFSISGLMEYLHETTKSEVMSLNRVHFCIGRIEAARLAISALTDVEHVQNLERRHGGSF